ncbi:IDEAL domain-containing protein [Paenibacillus sp. YYML68]|uniref:IDEAL domain-containing protein n=1 Tax=Paenibacillus sp. YYML68 TaxID=2909250 RepID=UPI00248F4965|nr:IDEAL domain-containing protein [Paenibacillus sp. YYML68]
MGKMNVTGDVMLGLFAEMVLDEAIRRYKEKKLYSEIDSALAAKDKSAFLVLTAELNKLRLERKCG